MFLRFTHYVVYNQKILTLRSHIDIIIILKSPKDKTPKPVLQIGATGLLLASDFLLSIAVLGLPHFMGKYRCGFVSTVYTVSDNPYNNTYK